MYQYDCGLKFAKWECHVIIMWIHVQLEPECFGIHAHAIFPFCGALQQQSSLKANLVVYFLFLYMHMQFRHFKSTGQVDGIASIVACRSLWGDTILQQVQDTGCKKGTTTDHYVGMKTGDET